MTKHIRLFFFILLALLFLYIAGSSLSDTPESPSVPKSDETLAFATYDLKTDTSRRNIPLEEVLSGGVGKDGIPAISSPSFTTVEETPLPPEAEGLLVSLNNEYRFYPFSILVWHEIVNDTFGEQAIAVTYCPLCDSGIVMDRTVEGETLEFKVSGLLFESNLLMYDTKTESLWSQALQEAVVGSYTGTRLGLLPVQRLSFADVETHYPTASVLRPVESSNRPYGTDPYAGYLEQEEVYFPISVTDKRFPAKELFYVIPFNNASLALPYYQLPDGLHVFTVKENTVVVKKQGSQIAALYNTEILPGYFELWFSWAIHHQEDGIVLTQ